MWRWMATWAVFVRRPSDLGYPDGGWQLPALSITDEVVPTGLPADSLSGGIAKRSAVRRQTIDAERVKRASRSSRRRDCGHALESVARLVRPERRGDARCEALGVARRRWSGPRHRGRAHRALARVAHGEVRGAHQQANHLRVRHELAALQPMLFLGLGDSFEQYYQAIRRCWRFGQRRPSTAAS
jgi:hypothetical protein